jgi:8-oxo-dGTP pyrophosphatase MutT (NUDIX family)
MNNKQINCNNCGKTGHLYHQCKLPIISYGIIVCRSSSEGLQFLMIRRKDSFGYIDFIRGKYDCSNLVQLQNTINEMSIYEKQMISVEPFDKLWKLLWSNDCFLNGEESMSKKFEYIKQNYLEDLIKNSTTNWEETEWEFPKGRKNFQEKDLDCALREFEEETGYSKNDVQVIQNIIPMEELYIGSNHKSYKHKYYLAFMNESVDINPLPEFQKTEVSKIEWKTLDDCLLSIRPYNLEKKRIITNIHQILNEYILI